MKAHVIENGMVVNTVEVDSLGFMPNLVNGENGGSIGDRYVNGEFLKPEPEAKTPEQIKSEIIHATQKRLDDFAGTRDYNSILSACTYATSTVPKFKADGQYCVNARDATWGKLYTMMAEVEAGKRPMPTGYADIEGLLPALIWPGS
jgi:hypothetical protein